MPFYKRSALPFGLKRFLLKAWDTALKIGIILVVSAIPAYAIAWLWSVTFFAHHIYFHEEMREIIIAAWIPTFGILYCLYTGGLILMVQGEYKILRIASKKKNIEEFMAYRDEDVSPLFHCIAAILAIAVLAGFMGLKYPNVGSGMMVIGGAAYIFSILCFAVYEIDDPCSGLWRIKSIPADWLTVDPKVWRNQHYKVTITTVTRETTTEERVSGENGEGKKAA